MTEVLFAQAGVKIVNEGASVQIESTAPPPAGGLLLDLRRGRRGRHRHLRKPLVNVGVFSRSANATVLGGGATKHRR